jgi:hypothetical protein
MSYVCFWRKSGTDTVQAIVKTFELTDVPVRAGRFVARKNWIVCGSDDFQLRVYSTFFYWAHASSSKIFRGACWKRTAGISPRRL